MTPHYECAARGPLCFPLQRGPYFFWGRWPYIAGMVLRT